MKAIMKSIKPKTCANIMNRIQSVLVIKNKREASAIQKLIDEYGYADIYVYCTKDKEQLTSGYSSDIKGTKYFIYNDNEAIDYRGKVLFKFRCYKVEEIGMWNWSEYGTPTLMENSLCIYSCLNFLELRDYIKDKPAYAIHISDLEIFDKPKELWEFYQYGKYNKEMANEQDWDFVKLITKVPLNFCYVEVE